MRSGISLMILPIAFAACTTGQGKAPALIQLTPATPKQVAERAFALAAVACRSEIERSASDTEGEAFRGRVLEWLTTAGITAALETEELELLQAPIGSLTEKQTMNAGWRAEGLGVLAWALGRWELGSFDAQTDTTAVSEALGSLEPKGLELLKAPTLRPLVEREELARRLYLLNRRLRQAYEGGGSEDVEQLAIELRVDPNKLGLVDGDLTIDGTRLADVPKDIVRVTISTVVEKHQAANWLLGDSPIYSKVSYSFRG